MPIDSGLKLLLALLYAPGTSGKYKEEIRGITRLEKLLFLLEKEGGFRGYYKFEAYNYGPWSSDVHDDIETLEEAGLIQTKTEKTRVFMEVVDERECREHEILDDEFAAPFDVEAYFLSDAGYTAAKKIFETQLTEEERKKLVEIKKKFNRLSLVDIIKHVYKNYPDIADKSKIKDKILAPSMFGKRPKLSHIERDEA